MQLAKTPATVDEIEQFREYAITTLHSSTEPISLEDLWRGWQNASSATDEDADEALVDVPWDDRDESPTRSGAEGRSAGPRASPMTMPVSVTRTAAREYWHAVHWLTERDLSANAVATLHRKGEAVLRSIAENPVTFDCPRSRTTGIDETHSFASARSAPIG